MSDIIPETPEGFFALLLAGVGAGFGLLVVWITDWVISIWEERTHEKISPTKRRWISLLVPAVLVVIGYIGSVLLGTIPFTQQTVWQAGVTACSAAGLKQVAYATIESWGKPAVVTNIGTQTNISEVSAQEDIYMGNTITKPQDQTDELPK